MASDNPDEIEISLCLWVWLWQTALWLGLGAVDLDITYHTYILYTYMAADEWAADQYIYI